MGGGVRTASLLNLSTSYSFFAGLELHKRTRYAVLYVCRSVLWKSVGPKAGRRKHASRREERTSLIGQDAQLTAIAVDAVAANGLPQKPRLPTAALAHSGARGGLRLIARSARGRAMQADRVSMLEATEFMRFPQTTQKQTTAADLNNRNSLI